MTTKIYSKFQVDYAKKMPKQLYDLNVVVTDLQAMEFIDWIKQVQKPYIEESQTFWLVWNKMQKDKWYEILSLS